MANETAEGITIVRVFNAPREDVWKEWTEPERFADWFGGVDADVPLDTVSMDVRVGGKWKATMFHGPEPTRIDWHGSYEVVDPPSKLLLTLSDRPGEEFEPISVELVDAGKGQTEMTMIQSGGHMDEAGYEHARQGWMGFFDRMEARLAA